uniref:hypothetical protein n=1 Tax=Lamprocystis purpurea TaxID=61598 RepID=UPI00047678C8
MAHSINIDATRLASPSFLIPGNSGSLSTGAIQSVQLEPGSYMIQTHATPDQNWSFVVTAQGAIDYAPALDVSQGGFLTGRNTSTLGVSGFPITLDARALATVSYAVSGITGWLANTAPHTLNLLPGAYGFQQPTGVVPGADFQVRLDGAIDYAAASDAFLTGRGSSTFTLLGYTITVDATALTAPQFHLSGITDWLASTQPRPLRLLPATYLFVHGSGRVPTADFTVTVAGLVDYPVTADGYLAGRGSGTFTLLGYAITVDATAL